MTGVAYHPEMHQTDITASAVPAQVETEAASGAAPPPLPVSRQPRRGRLVAAVVTLAAVVLTGAVWNAVADERAKAALEDARSTLAEHVEDRAQVMTTADEVLVRGAEVHRSSEGEVLDDSVRDHLDAALVALDEALGDLREVVTAPSGADVASVREVVAAVAPAVTSTVLAVDEAETGIAAVLDATAERTLVTARESVEELVAELGALVVHGDELLSSTEGEVLDEATREHLAEVLGRAADHLAEPPPADADLGGAVDTLRDVVAGLAAAVTEVEGSSTGWQEERAQLAAVRQSPAAQPSTAPSSTPRPGTAGTSDGPQQAGSGQRLPAAVPAPAPAPPPAPAAEQPPAPGPVGDGSYWVETETGFGSDLCMDEFGNSWEC